MEAMVTVTMPAETAILMTLPEFRVTPTRAETTPYLVFAAELKMELLLGEKKMDCPPLWSTIPATTKPKEEFSVMAARRKIPMVEIANPPTVNTLQP